MWNRILYLALPSLALLCAPVLAVAQEKSESTKHSQFFEKRIRPILVKHCYECHSEEAQESQGGLLLDRRAGWLKGGDTQAAVVPGNPASSLLIKAVKYKDEDLQMPPNEPLNEKQIQLLVQWVKLGAPGPRKDLVESEFSRLGDQDFLSGQAVEHWAFRPRIVSEIPQADDPKWNESPVDQFVYARLNERGLTPSGRADPRTLLRRLTFDLTGLPPASAEMAEWLKTALPKGVSDSSYHEAVERLIDSPAFGEHFGRVWLDVARYADTDSFYRPDTRTPHYFPFAFTYRDYVIRSLNADKPFDRFVREQLAADLMGLDDDAPEIAALGFLTVGPYANRNQAEALDDWIDVTTRGLMGLTVACARCHDHKYEPVPTADYYALRGVFAGVVRVNPLDEKKQPLAAGYDCSEEDRADYEKQRAAIDAKINEAAGKKAKGNNRSIAQKIRETELAELLLFHPGAPARTMIVTERPRVPDAFVFLRGDATRRGDRVERRFLSVLDKESNPFAADNSGRLELADKIVDPSNPLTARVFVNRVWGRLLGKPLVATPSDFGLQGAKPTHPKLLDWLAQDFIDHGWSVKHLVRTIVLSRTYQQSSGHRRELAEADPENELLGRANRKHLPIEAIRDSMLFVSGQLDRTRGGRAAPMWGDDYTRRRSVYGYINRFNLDPTLRVFDFPTPMQTQPGRKESIVAPQSLFTMNSPFVVEQSVALTNSDAFKACDSDDARIQVLFQRLLQRSAVKAELTRIGKFVASQQRFFEQPRRGSKVASPWPLVAQSLMMSNEFQYVD